VQTPEMRQGFSTPDADRPRRPGDDLIIDPFPHILSHFALIFSFLGKFGCDAATFRRKFPSGPVGKKSIHTGCPLLPQLIDTIDNWEKILFSLMVNIHNQSRAI
jgi:hypothetical protein